jgi:hypothetical protein
VAFKRKLAFAAGGIDSGFGLIGGKDLNSPILRHKPKGSYAGAKSNEAGAEYS